MKSVKCIISLFGLILLVFFATACSQPTVSAKQNIPVEKRTAYLNSEVVFKGGNDERTYNFKLDNKEYIDEDWDIYSNGEGGYYLPITGRKITKNIKPIITIYEYKTSTQKVPVKKIEITVKKSKPLNQNDITVRKGGAEIIKFPYVYDDVKVKYSKKGVAQFKEKTFFLSGRCSKYVDYKHKYCIEGIKNGTTRITFYQKSDNLKLGSFKVKVMNLKPMIKKKYKSVTVNMDAVDNGLAVEGLVKNSLSKAKYSAVVKNKKVAYALSSSDDNNIDYFCIRPIKAGQTKVTVFEKYKGKTEIVSTINLKSKNGTMGDRAQHYISDDTDGCKLTKFKSNKCDLKKKLINYYLSGVYKKSEYKITFRANYPDVLSVDKNGIVTRHKKKSKVVANIYFTINFKDGSKCSCYTNSDYN